MNVPFSFGSCLVFPLLSAVPCVAMFCPRRRRLDSGCASCKASRSRRPLWLRRWRVAMHEIRLAIAGVGNCASALLQGLEYYRTHDPAESAGVLHPEIGGYRLEDVHPVAAFDVDVRKVGRPLEEAAFALPNCTKVFQEKLPAWGIGVQMGPVLDGVAEHMAAAPAERSFRVAQAEPVDVVRVLRETGAEVLVCYLPVGSERAIRHYAEACLEARVGFVNCVPVFIASDPAWARR